MCRERLNDLVSYFAWINNLVIFSFFPSVFCIYLVARLVFYNVIYAFYPIQLWSVLFYNLFIDLNWRGLSSITNIAFIVLFIHNNIFSAFIPYDVYYFNRIEADCVFSFFFVIWNNINSMNRNVEFIKSKCNFRSVDDELMKLLDENNEWNMIFTV